MRILVTSRDLAEAVFLWLQAEGFELWCYIVWLPSESNTK